MKLKKKYIGKCDGKPITFKQLKAFRQNTPAPKANEATARVSPPSTVGSDSESEEFNSTFGAFNRQQSEEFGYGQNVAGFSIDGVITAESIPSYAELKETESISDKSCIICLKDNMDLEELSGYYCYEHTITFSEEYVDVLETWEEMADDWSYNLSKAPDSQNRYSSSEEQPLSDYENSFAQTSPKKAYSGNSLDSSSSVKSSKSRSSRKSASKRNFEDLK